MRTLVRNLLTVALVATLSVPAAANDVERPGAFTMFGDLVVARPIGVVVTAVGSVAFVLALPFSALGGNVEESAEALVMGPARETFQRCLGCTSSGRYYAPASDDR
jgi:hypothetical protein